MTQVICFYVFIVSLSLLVSTKIRNILKHLTHETMYGFPATTPQFHFHGEDQCSQILDEEFQRYESTGEATLCERIAGNYRFVSPTLESVNWVHGSNSGVM